PTGGLGRRRLSRGAHHLVARAALGSRGRASVRLSRDDERQDEPRRADADGVHPAGDAPAGLGVGPALADRAVRLGVLGQAHMLRAALIVTLALAIPASADLWTS